MRVFLIKIFVFLFLILIAQYALFSFGGAYFSRPMRVDHIWHFDEYVKKHTEIILLGDSIYKYVDSSDQDKRTLPQMLQEALPGYTFGAMAFESFGMSVFQAFCEYSSRRAYRPRLIVIPVNIRSFSQFWDKAPGWQFELLRAILVSRCSQVLRLFPRQVHCILNFIQPKRLTLQEYKDTPIISYDGHDMGKIGDFISFTDFSDEKARKYITCCYLYTLTDNHRKIAAAKELIRILKKINVKVLFYFEPLDYESGEKYFPGVFIKKVYENNQVVIAALRRCGVETLDFTFLLSSDLFSWVYYPNEHLNERGRKVLTDQLVDAIKKKVGSH